MKTMRIPGFTAEESLDQASGQYQARRYGFNSTMDMVIPAIPRCANCDQILERCENNGWRPRAVCNACAAGNCYDEPPMPNPFPDPFDFLPRFSRF